MLETSLIDVGIHDVAADAALSGSPWPQFGQTDYLCPSCSARLNVVKATRREVVACPECGQCVDASVDFGLTSWSINTTVWPFEHKCMSGWKEVLMSFGIGVLGYVPWLPTY